MGQTMASRIKEAECVGEPSLDELFAEPIIQLFMKRDGVKASEMRGQFTRLSRDYGAQPAV